MTFCQSATSSLGDLVRENDGDDSKRAACKGKVRYQPFRIPSHDRRATRVTRPFRGGPTCIIHQDGHLAPRLHDALFEGLDTLQLADIHDHTVHLPAGTLGDVLDLLVRVRQVFGVNIGEEDFHALGCERLCRGETDAASVCGIKLARRTRAEDGGERGHLRGSGLG